MKMKHTLTAIGLCAALGLSAPALACPPEAADHCDFPAVSPWQKMHDALKLTPEQETRWQAMQEHSRARMEKHQQEMEALMERQEKEREAGMLEFKEFRDSLSDEQRKTMDAQLHHRHGAAKPAARPAKPATK